MSGTLTSDDINEAKDLFCMEDNILTVTASPVMPSHYFLNIQRPNNLQGRGSKDNLYYRSGEIVVSFELMNHFSKFLGVQHSIFYNRLC